MLRLFIIAITLVGLTACTNGKRTLHDFSGETAGPDEFSVMPSRPLEMPADLNVLPTPTPGGSNLTDANPMADAIVALGGNPAAVQGAIPAADTALLAHVNRNGVSPNIRADLAEEDARFRRRRTAGPFRGGDRYFRAYAGQALDAQSEMDRFRNIGVQVPSAPPAQ
ncbi:DUF3035 domain-containing protein [Aestuariibius sp. HNIBRBA575]|uniref:DUF3035 domain-containing protein n=1 Tax=Aestuariibius sp. HNIBRBA575 TaxID=3233343 RepID=UPI0034A4428F